MTETPTQTRYFVALDTQRLDFSRNPTESIPILQASWGTPREAVSRARDALLDGEICTTAHVAVLQDFQSIKL